MEQKARALMSYARPDDQQNGDFFNRFRDRLSNEIRAQTGEEFQIFQDTEDIRWGQYFQDRVEDTAQALTFFIPVITPDFFRCEYCRDELRKFLRREEALHRNDLILPMYYVESDTLTNQTKRTSDSLAQVIAMRASFDWRALQGQSLDASEAQFLLEDMAKHIRDSLQQTRKLLEQRSSPMAAVLHPTAATEAYAPLEDYHYQEPTGPAEHSPVSPLQPLSAAESPALFGMQQLQLQGILHQNAGTIVHSLSFNRSGTMLALGGRDNTVQLWDMATGEELQRFEGHTNYVVSVAFSPDGRIIASGSRDNSIRLWSVEGEREGRKLMGHNGRVTNIAFSPDGSLLASCSGDKTVRLWDISKEKQLRRMEGHTRLVTSVAFNPDGTLLASGCEDHTVRLWETSSGRETMRLERHKDHVRSVAFSPDGSIVASAGDDKIVYLWDVASGHMVRRLDHHTSGVECVAFSPDGSILASGSHDKTIWFYEMASDAVDLATSKWGDSVWLPRWEMGNIREFLHLDGKKDFVRSLTFNADGGLLAIVTDAYTIRICGLGLPVYQWDELEKTWHDLLNRRLQRRRAMRRCAECGAKLSFVDWLTRERLCKDCR
jgi:hypothetical protein